MAEKKRAPEGDNLAENGESTPKRAKVASTKPLTTLSEIRMEMKALFEDEELTYPERREAIANIRPAKRQRRAIPDSISRVKLSNNWQTRSATKNRKRITTL